jgi:hypothetical protein
MPQLRGMAMKSAPRTWPWFLVATGGVLFFVGPLFNWTVYGARHCPHGLGPEPCRTSQQKGYELFPGRVILALGLVLMTAVIVGLVWRRQRMLALIAPVLGLLAIGLEGTSFQSAARVSGPTTVVLPDPGLYLVMAGALLTIVGGALLLRRPRRREEGELPSWTNGNPALALALVGLGGALGIGSTLFSWASYTELGYGSASLGTGYHLSDGRLILFLGAALVLVAVIGWRWRELFTPAFASLALGVFALGDAIAASRAVVQIPSPLLLASYMPNVGLRLAIIGAVLATLGGCLLLYMTMPLRRETVLGAPEPSLNASL